MPMRGSWGIAVLHLAGWALGLGSLPAAEPPDYLFRQLSPDGEPASRVAWSPAIDPRGEWVLFVGDVEIAGAEAVYAMRRNGSELHRLSVYGATGSIGGYYFSADGRRVLYLGDLDLDGLQELWSVAPSASAASAVKLNVPVVGGGVTLLQVPEVGDRIAYIAETAGGRGVWSVPAAGPSSANVRLDPPAVGDETLQSLLFRPDGAHVVLQFTDNVAFTTRLFTVPVGGPLASAILLAENATGECAAVGGVFTPDSTRLVYFRFCPPAFSASQIWSVPAAGPAGSAVSLGGSFADGGNLQGLAISPDSQRVVFIADRLVDERVELWSVPVAGPAAAIVRLNPSLVTNGDVKTGFRISPDSSRVAYIADQVSDERFFPYSVPIAGPSTEAVSLYQGVLLVGADALDLAFTPDSSRVVFRFDLAVNDRFDLYSAPADGSAVQARITNRGVPPAPPRSVASTWLVHPDGERVFYVFDELASGDRRGLGEQRLLDPYATDTRLNGAPATGGQVNHVFLYPDGAGLIFHSDEAADGKNELFTVDLRLLGDGFESSDTNAWPDAP